MGHAGIRGATSLIFCFHLWIIAKGELNDKVPRVYWGNAGEGNAAIDPGAITYDGEPNFLMITKVIIGYFDYEGTKDIRCVAFSYGDEEKECGSDFASDIDTFTLDRDEYVTQVSGTQSMSITKITVTTNKRTIGPYGQTGAADQFVAENGGAPLLYSKIAFGSFSVYEMSFTFYATKVDDLKDITDQVATETYDVVTSVITNIFTVQEDYAHMLLDVGRKGCYPYQVEQTPEALTACNLQNILSQVNVLASSTTSHMDHTTRNLVPYATYDSEEFVKQVQQASQFHDLLTQLEFDLQTVIDVTAQQSEQLNAYFSAQAEFDKQIAQQDIIYFQGQLDRCQTGAAEASANVGERLIRIIDTGISLLVFELAEDAFTLGAVIAENCNPFKWLFGGPEIEDIMEAADDFMETTRDMATMAYLRDHVDEYLQLSEEIAQKFADNAEQIAAMNEMVEAFDTVNDTDELLQMTEDYIQAYGAYSPQVTEQEIAYMSALLSAIGDEACSIIADAHGFVSDTSGMIYESVQQDCLYLPADQASLDSYYEETYSLQFELVDAMTSVVRYSVAEHMAGDIGVIGLSIDVESATIGTCMLEIHYQASCQARCDILEYVDAGKRPDVCKNLLFTDDQISSLIAYKSDLSKSERDSFAYFPSSNKHEVNIPFLDIEKVLRGEKATIRLPYNNTQWMMDYGWLPGYYGAETGFYFEVIEPFIPGLKCNETNQPNAKVYVELVSGKPQILYKEETEPTFTIFQQKVKFSYETNTSPCPGSYVTYPVVRNDTENFEADEEVSVCVTSEGIVSKDDRDDFTLPSLYVSWNMTINSDSHCTLVFDPDFEFQPMVTFKIKIREVMAKTTQSDPGIDECWPDGSRCDADQWCVDETLGYHCQDGQPVAEQILELLTDIRDRLYKLVSLFKALLY